MGEPTATYSITEASHYLRIPKTTLRSWICQRLISVEHRTKRPESMRSTDKGHGRISFSNLVEAYVLDSIRQEVRLQGSGKVLRGARDCAAAGSVLATRASVASTIFAFVDGTVRRTGNCRTTRFEITNALHGYLGRIDWSENGTPARLYPFTTKGKDARGPRVIVIDPEISFGRPMLVGTGIPTATLAERHQAGERMDEIARDYDVPQRQLRIAIQCELVLASSQV